MSRRSTESPDGSILHTSSATSAEEDDALMFHFIGHGKFGTHVKV